MIILNRQLSVDGTQDPYYRGLGGADFSKQRRPGGAVGTIGGFSPIALPIALEINDPRYDVMLAPAHRPKWASWRSAEIRTASMKPQLKLGLSSPHPDLSRCSKTAGSSKRPPARATASRASAIAQKSSAACRIPQGVTREAEPHLWRGFVPPNLFVVTVAFWASGRARLPNLRRLCPTHRSIRKHR